MRFHVYARAFKTQSMRIGLMGIDGRKIHLQCVCKIYVIHTALPILLLLVEKDQHCMGKCASHKEIKMERMNNIQFVA